MNSFLLSISYCSITWMPQYITLNKFLKWHQAIALNNFDQVLWGHMASPDHKESPKDHWKTRVCYELFITGGSGKSDKDNLCQKWPQSWNMTIIRSLLTHWGRVMHICVGKLTIIESDDGLSPGWHQAIIRNIVNWTLSNKIHWNLNRNSFIFIHENASENIVREMAAILSRGIRVNLLLSFTPAAVLSPQ